MPGGRPPKPAEIIRLEGASHRTKEELKLREDAEAALLTGKHMEMWPEVRKNRRAAAEFKRVSELFKIIDKDDALHEGVVNRYCLLRAECAQFEEKREAFYKGIKELKQAYKEGEIKAVVYFDSLGKMQASVIALDKQIMSKRNMMLAIEKENLMTIASALRSIPKTPEKKEKPSGMAAFLSKRAEAK